MSLCGAWVVRDDIPVAWHQKPGYVIGRSHGVTVSQSKGSDVLNGCGLEGGTILDLGSYSSTLTSKYYPWLYHFHVYHIMRLKVDEWICKINKNFDHDACEVGSFRLNNRTWMYSKCFTESPHPSYVDLMTRPCGHHEFTFWKIWEDNTQMLKPPRTK